MQTTSRSAAVEEPLSNNIMTNVKEPPCNNIKVRRKESHEHDARFHTTDHKLVL